MNPTHDSILEVRDLVTSFATDDGRVTAVDGVSFTVPRGKTLGIVGESGCGKSVTAFSITRLLPQPHGQILGGSILFEGQDLVTLPLAEMHRLRGREISMIFQEPMTALNPVQTVGRQLAEAILLHTSCSKRDVLARSIDMMKKVRIPAPEQRLNEYPHQLSGGMRQRVMIAMALVNKPKLLIADEPTTALDVTVQAQILALIADLQKEMGMSVVLITHDLGVIAEVCDEVVVMYAGRVVERASVYELFSNPRHAYTRGLLESIPKLDSTPKTKLKAILGNVPGIADFKPGCRFAERSGHPHSPEQLNTRPPFVEVSPNHWVEHCPVCAGLEIAAPQSFAIIKSVNSDSDHEKPSRTTPESSFESALGYLSTSKSTSGAASDGQSRKVQCQSEFRTLAAWAKSSGKLIVADRFQQITAQGAEHRVYHDQTNGLAYKVTNLSLSGMSYDQGEPVAATPYEYLNRWLLQNEIFGDTAEFEGVIEAPHGYNLVVSQRWITGDVPTEDEIKNFMSHLGFVSTALPECFYREEDDLAAMDCHDGNFVKLENELVVPIDVILQYSDQALRTRLGIAP
jgi:peptide/nickel transport system ATP-binding protein